MFVTLKDTKIKENFKKQLCLSNIADTDSNWKYVKNRFNIFKFKCYTRYCKWYDSLAFVST